jgi:predicted butyrate kinase (DUF1464 family)
MKKIEEFVRNNREQLDIYDPSPSVWEKIAADTKKKRLSPGFIFSRAAVLLLLIASSFMVYTIIYNNQQTLYGLSNSNDNVQVNSLDETATYYQNMANNLMKEVKPMLVGNPAVKSELMSEISNLDELCADIRKDLKDNMNNEEVVEALILNYRIKVQLLEDALAAMKAEKTENNDNIKGNEL